MKARLTAFLRALTVALMNDGIPDLPPEELGMAIDEDNKNQGRGPDKRTAEQGVADMEARIKYLNDQLQRNQTESNRLGSTDYEARTLKETREKLARDLQDAQQRLAEYRSQLNKN